MLRRLAPLALGLGVAVGCVPDDRRIQDKTAAPARPTAAPARAAAGTPEDPALLTPFHDDFERAELGSSWLSRSPAWKLEGGKLCVKGARNQPAWLKRRLPTNARIAFDATSASPDGDIKAELWGDGRSGATGTSYTNATSYLTIFGGWKNTFHVLARIDEHAPNRPEIKLDPESMDPRTAQVQAGRVYRFEIERADGKSVRWSVDGTELFTFVDPAPLIGAGHEHFGFNDWDVPVCFDNLDVTPLG